MEIAVTASLKDTVINSTVRDLPRTKGQHKLGSAARDKKIGCIFPQEQKDVGIRLSGYWSLMLNDKAQTLVTAHRQCPAVVSAVTSLPPYFEETRFTIRTGHDTFQTILNTTKVIGKLACWQMRLLESDFDVFKYAGIKHWQLSHRPVPMQGVRTLPHWTMTPPSSTSPGNARLCAFDSNTQTGNYWRAQRPLCWFYH